MSRSRGEDELSKLMMSRVLLISDTHLPTRARSLPESVWREISGADFVVHAGDWVSAELVYALKERAQVLIGVQGNNDDPTVTRMLPVQARFDLAGLRWAVMHETGARQGRERRCDAAFPDADVVVFGHSHIPWDSATPGGRRLLNPGSPTDRRRQPRCTYMTVDVSESDPQVGGPAALDVQLHQI